MKRLCLIIAYLFLFTQTASAMPLLVGQKVVYRGTITGLRISAVDGTAFIDNAGATVPTYADGKHQITIYDSAGRMLRGVLKTAGSAETLSETELVTNGDMELDSNWENQITPTTNERSSEQAHGGTYSRKFTADAAYVGIKQTTTSLTIGQLFYSSAWVYGDGSMKFRFSAHKAGFSANTSSTVGYAYPASWTNVAYYGTSIESEAFYICTAASTPYTGTAYVDDVSVKQVTAPSSAGATIVSTKGGTTYNFSYKNASFTYNASSYYVIIRAIR